MPSVTGPGRDELVADARERLIEAVRSAVPFPEMAFALRGDTCLLVVGGAQPARRLLGAALVVADADVLLHVSHATAAVDGGAATDALAVVDLPATGTGALELHPIRRYDDTVAFDPAVTFGADTAVFGQLVEDLRATWDRRGPEDRVAALVQLERAGLVLEVAPALDAELVGLIEAHAAGRTS